MRISIELEYLSDGQLIDLTKTLLDAPWHPSTIVRAIGAIACEQYNRECNLRLARDLAAVGVYDEDALARNLARTRVPE